MTKSGLCSVICSILLILDCESSGPIRFVEQDGTIDVLYQNRLVTSYQYSTKLPKPILYPLLSPSGIQMNRSFPIDTVAGESDDHPHHQGLYFTVDEVNHNRFWGNTGNSPQIVCKQIVRQDEAEGLISVVHHWIGANGKVLLVEERDMQVQPGPDQYSLDFKFRLTAKDTAVDIHDTKEGLFAIRVADWLREGDGTGRYLSSNNEETEANVWGKRASWMRLEGEKDGKPLGIAILNHPESLNYPTYWMARGYGLFSANPFGQLVYQTFHKVADPEPLNLHLEVGESVLLRFRMIVYEGRRGKADMDAAFVHYCEI